MLVPEKICINFGKYPILNEGNKFAQEHVRRVNNYLKQINKNKNFPRVGQSSSTMWTCDLTKYISINADTEVKISDCYLIIFKNEKVLITSDPTQNFFWIL